MNSFLISLIYTTVKKHFSRTSHRILSDFLLTANLYIKQKAVWPDTIFTIYPEQIHYTNNRIIYHFRFFYTRR